MSLLDFDRQRYIYVYNEVKSQTAEIQKDLNIPKKKALQLVMELNPGYAQIMQN